MKRKFVILLCLVLILTTACQDETRVRSIELDPVEMTLAIGQTRQIELTINPTSAAIYNPKYWSSSNKNVADVDSRGRVTGIYAGTCIITATVDGIKATCRVTVETPTYDLNLDSCIVFDQGTDLETGTMVRIVRLYEHSLDIDTTGRASGNGFMLNLYSYMPITATALATGSYVLDNSHRELTMLPGAIEEIDGSRYAAGTFLGQYSDDGLGVLTAKSGHVQITDQGGQYTVSCRLTGGMNEAINATWQGVPRLVRSDTVAEPEDIYYVRAVLIDTTVAGECATRHTSVLFIGSGKSVEMTLRLPLGSSSPVLEGEYTMDSREQSYTIVPGTATIELGGRTVDLKSVTLHVKSVDGFYEYSAGLVDDEGRSYRLSKKQKSEQFRQKQRLLFEKKL